ncbi:MAG TPA: SPFH domain-containing protein [Bryobacteraceae bacterium]|nr:SPFH domain-containing protein [Bryobacteraceae bacterium]
MLPLLTALTPLAAFVMLILILMSIYSIGPTQVGLVRKRFGAKLPGDDPVAFRGEAGYQAQMLMPGLRFKFCLVYAVSKHPWVQVPAGQIGVVIAQVGKSCPMGAKSAIYRPEFGNFSDLRIFIEQGGQKGVQRPVLPPGTLAPLHPMAFLVITKPEVFGVPVASDLSTLARSKGRLTYHAFGLEEKQLEVTRISPRPSEAGRVVDMIGIITTLEGQPLPAGDIASRLGGFTDITEMEEGDGGAGITDARLIETILGNQNDQHSAYQDFQKFLDLGGRIGLQHDPLLYGAYNLNPFLLRVEEVPMLVVEQGQVAVMKAYSGLPTQDTSGVDFKFGSLVRPGHRGIWQEPLRTGKYPINPRCYQAVIVPTFIITLNWADVVSQAHNLDAQLKQIEAKSSEGFAFAIDLQVQIHIPDTQAPYVISMVGSVPNLVNEVLQAAVGNHFRNKLQGMPAVRFIASRESVQQGAFEYVKEELSKYRVETRGVYIQAVVLPAQLVEVLTQREIANQEVETYKMQKSAQDQRTETEKAKGTADMQAELAKAQVGVDIQNNRTAARKMEALGEAAYIEQTGAAQGAQVRSVGLARAEAYAQQVAALGANATALVNAIEALSKSTVPFTPNTLVMGGGEGSGALTGLLALLMRQTETGLAKKTAAGQ